MGLEWVHDSNAQREVHPQATEDPVSFITGRVALRRLFRTPAVTVDRLAALDATNTTISKEAPHDTVQPIADNEHIGFSPSFSDESLNLQGRIDHESERKADEA